VATNRPMLGISPGFVLEGVTTPPVTCAWAWTLMSATGITDATIEDATVSRIHVRQTERCNTDVMRMSKLDESVYLQGVTLQYVTPCAPGSTTYFIPEAQTHSLEECGRFSTMWRHVTEPS